MFGNGGFALPVCSFLLLQLPALPLTNNWPLKDRSEGRLEQWSNHLQPSRFRGQDEKQIEKKEEVFQWWGEWSSWSSCSRSCGGGVRSQGRHCLIQRLSSSQNPNGSICAGSSKQYQLCPSKACSSPSVSFKQHQCSQFNSKAFGRRYYQWIPLYPADYISISSKSCDLQCTTINGERQLLVPAQDGTFCRDTKYHGVCIEGTCQPVGCDGKLYSSMAVDRCGICGGNGTSCQRISGSYRKALTQLGYVFITNIPAGASDIQIIEKRKTENVLALSDEAGHFFFNGNSLFDNPQNFHVAGTVFKYRRPSNVFSDGLEYVMAQGPTLQGLNVLYYNLNGKLPHITYEYTVPLPSLDATSTGGVEPDPVNSYGNLTFNEVNEHIREDQPLATNHSRGSTTVHPYNSQSHEEEDVEEVVWEIKTPSPPPSAAILLYKPADIYSHNDVEQPPVPSGYRSSTNSVDEPSTADEEPVLLSFPGGHPGGFHPATAVRPEDAPYLLQEDLQNNQTQSDKHSDIQSAEQTPTTVDVENKSESATRSESERTLETGSDLPTITVTHLQSDSHSDTNATKLVRLLQVSAVHRVNTESNNFDLGLETDVSLADMYRWKVSAYAPCSSTCTTGIVTSYALCIRYDGTEVDDRFCDSVTRPEPTHEFCTGKECPPRWETSGWSECSRTCAEGFQYRTVRCWKMLSPGLDSSVYDSLCLSHDLHKPASRKVCLGQSCGPQWEVSDWSECSARCGSRGVRTREVRCSTDMRSCNRSSQPIESQECEGPPCDRRWTVSDWGPCSGVCGEGRMMRAVSCKSSGGVVMSEEQCDQTLRPLAIYPCGDRDCAPHWVEQEWQQCNATCGRGVRQRQVVCAGLEAGVFKEFPESSCDKSNKPESTSSCFQRPCSKWFTTSWSQCTKTCGRGVQVREVKCYQGEDLVTRGHSCDSALKPEARQSCETHNCQPEPTVSSVASAPIDDSCRDKPTANCALVLKVKLCSHWYYRKACCQSCKAARP
ncbi:ADAMTS-like protein 2 isoform X2 [Takifugu rubripes]|uniref:ADAMTS-like protein 2 isoform X2 n=1 Tax=Takifugu rubripes TaxID=31033 RepID=UPI0011459B62|nr:ADAMTS-like protein 2 isoform X2 [Takifugu rubripes]